MTRSPASPQKLVFGTFGSHKSHLGTYHTDAILNGGESSSWQSDRLRNGWRDEELNTDLWPFGPLPPLSPDYLQGYPFLESASRPHLALWPALRMMASPQSCGPGLAHVLMDRCPLCNE